MKKRVRARFRASKRERKGERENKTSIDRNIEREGKDSYLNLLPPENDKVLGPSHHELGELVR